MKVDIIVVGLGLAGTLLVNELIQSGKSVIAFDDPEQPKASNVAAGIVNPVVFRQMTKSWMADSAFPEMEKTCRQLEELLGMPIYNPSKICRVFGKDDLELWRRKEISNGLQIYLESDFGLTNRNHLINAPYGTGIICRAGRLDISKLITGFSKFLAQQQLLENCKFELDKLKLTGNSASYKNIVAEKIIFCEGSLAAQNPFFNNLKFKSSKGEVIDLHIPGLNLSEIISSDIFILPTGGENYKIGATYSWDLSNWQTTDSARTELILKFKKIYSGDYRILNHQAGIRPTMHDRKPVLGFLPEIPQIGIFNGLGSKGVLLGPYFAKQFAEYISGKTKSISEEVNLSRYF
jgi:glycine/D-amino acid oxidase-like deaminating enzyme